MDDTPARDAEERAARRARAAAALDERTAQRAAATDGARRLALIDEAQQAVHRRLRGSRSPLVAALSAAAPQAALLVVMGLIVSQSDPPWSVIAEYLAVLFVLVFAVGWWRRRVAERAGLRTTEWRLPRAGREQATWFNLLPIVGVAATAPHVGRWWIGVPFAVLTVPIALGYQARWAAAYRRAPRPGPGRVAPGASPALASDNALVATAVLALVDWARAGMVAEIAGRATAGVEAAIAPLVDAGNLRRSDDPDPRLELTPSGRLAFERHAAWLVAGAPASD